MNPTDQPTPTPETDEVSEWTGDELTYAERAPADFARRLECERNALKSALEAEQEGNRTLSLTMGGMKKGENFREFCKRVATERDAAIADREKLREALEIAATMMNEVGTDYAPDFTNPHVRVLWRSFTAKTIALLSILKP